MLIVSNKKQFQRRWVNSYDNDKRKILGHFRP